MYSITVQSTQTEAAVSDLIRDRDCMMFDLTDRSDIFLVEIRDPFELDIGMGEARGNIIGNITFGDDLAVGEGGRENSRGRRREGRLPRIPASAYPGRYPTRPVLCFLH
jgi:hypothetical protein